MHPILRNTAAVIAGLAVGSLVNMGLVQIGPHVVPLPAGADFSTMDSLRDSMGLLRPVHFLFPFLAHALGTLAGAILAARLATGRHVMFGMGIGVFFLVGGISMVMTVGGPVWFSVVDLLLAYLPMGYLGGVLGRR